ncbi:MAG: hypothetical protein AB7S26_25300 [Sandaracinaceae bacterium]
MGRVGVAMACGLAAIVAGAASARAQCRTECRSYEHRDPFGCCVGERPRRTRTPSRTRPAALVGDAGSVLAPELGGELYHWARGWLAQARDADRIDRAYAIELYRRAAGASLAFLAALPEDVRAGRMRAVVVAGLDGASLVSAAEREASALGGPRPEPESPEVTRLRADTLLNLGWAHRTIGQQLEEPHASIARHTLAVARSRRASEYYALYVALYPDAVEAAGARSELANALNAAGEHLEAARVLEELAARVPSRHLEGLRRASDAYERALHVASADGRVALLTEPPEASMRPPWARAPAIPEPLERLLAARARYVQAASAEPSERDDVRAERLDSARWLYRYARWDRAITELVAVLEGGCDDAAAEEATALMAAMRATDRAAVACASP